MSPRTALGCLAALVALTSCKDKDKDEASSATAPSAAPLSAQPAAPTESPEPAAPPEASASANPEGAGSADAAADAAAPDAGEKMTPAGRRFGICCSALKRAARARPAQARGYEYAGEVCAALVTSLNIGAADLNTVRKTMRNQLQGVPIPSGC
jgi:hypothetical protein